MADGGWHERAVTMDQLTGAGLTAFVVSGLVSAVIKLSFDRKLERYKSELTSRSAKELEKLKAELLSANQQALEQLRAKLQADQKEHDARRDYEYEARKRLYVECEPLLFQLVELSNNALRRIRSIARTSRKGDLRPDGGWLSGDGYYMLSTFYILFVPLVVYKLIQDRLTLIDLTLDRYVAEQYRLAKCLYLSFTEDFSLAVEAPSLEYSPDSPDWRENSTKTPERYWRQGVYLGILESLVESLIIEESGRAPRAKTFGEFASEYRQQGSSLHRAFGEARHLLLDFHPKTRPIFWRILSLQVIIYQALMRTRETPLDDHLSGVRGLTEEDLKGLDWRRAEDNESFDDAVMTPVAAARTFLVKRLQDFSSPFRR